MCVDTFRTANQSDAEAIAQLVNKAYRPNSGNSGWTHESELVAGDRTTVSQVVEILSKPDSFILIGLRNSETVACVHVEKDHANSYIGMLSINPILQGVGVGKEMLAYAENYATKVFGSEKFVMVVLSARTELIAFYLRRGYRKTGVVMDYPLSAGAGVPIQPNLKVEILEKIK